MGCEGEEQKWEGGEEAGGGGGGGVEGGVGWRYGEGRRGVRRPWYGGG